MLISQTPLLVSLEFVSSVAQVKRDKKDFVIVVALSLDGVNF